MEYLTDLRDAVKRYLPVLLVLAIVTAIGIAVDRALIKVVVIATSLECIAIALSSLAAFTYTRLRFTNDAPLVLGYVFVGVHALVGLTVLGCYIAQYWDSMVPGQ